MVHSFHASQVTQLVNIFNNFQPPNAAKTTSAARAAVAGGAGELGRGKGGPVTDRTPGEGVRPVGDAHNPASVTGPTATALSLQQAALWAISACAEDPKIRANLKIDEDDTLKKVLVYRNISMLCGLKLRSRGFMLALLGVKTL